MHLCHHFQLELVEFLVPTDTVLMICDLTARLLSSSLPPIPFLIISKQTSNVYLITWKNFDTGVKTKFFANLFHSVKHSFKCLCEEGFYWTVTIVDYIKKKYLDFWFPFFHNLFKFLFIYLLIGSNGSLLQHTDTSLMHTVLGRGGCSSIVGCGLLIAVMASLVGEQGL